MKDSLIAIVLMVKEKSITKNPAAYHIHLIIRILMRWKITGRNMKANLEMILKREREHCIW